MKITEVKVGEVYAYRSGKYGTLYPVLVLDTPTRYQSAGRWATDSPMFVKAREDLQRSGFGDGLGLLAVMIDVRGGEYAFPLLPGLREVTLDQVLALRTGTKDLGLPKGVKPKIINPRWLIGPFEDVLQAEADDRELKASLSDLEKAERQAEVDAAKVRVNALRALGLPGDLAEPRVTRGYVGQRPWVAENAQSVRLTMEQVDALLSLIPDGARIEVAPEVEDDGWTYAEGPKPEAVGSVYVAPEPEEEPVPEPVKPQRVRKPNGTYYYTEYVGNALYEALGGDVAYTGHRRATFKATTSSALSLIRMLCAKDGQTGPALEDRVKRAYGHAQRFGMPHRADIEEDLEPEVLFVTIGEAWHGQKVPAVWVRYDSLTIEKRH